MLFFTKRKDGGPQSTVDGYWLVEIKPLFTVVLLHFNPGTRPVYHSHSFDAVSWVLWGHLEERVVNQQYLSYHLRPGLHPVVTPRNRFHQVESHGHSWVLSFRGPWVRYWYEWRDGVVVKLTHGREEVHTNVK